MIPKKIHYCWFGRGTLPPLTQQCIASWKKYLPEHEIIEWNEDNFDVNCIPYVEQAYARKRYAFVSDYTRFTVLAEQGGLYFDTDLELLKPLDSFLSLPAFLGFESAENIASCILGAAPEHPAFRTMKELYESRDFVLEDGSVDQTTNVTLLTNYLLEKGLVLNDSVQIVDGFHVFPRSYFSPIEYRSKETHYSDETHTVHHYMESWKTPTEKAVVGARYMAKNLLGEKGYRVLKKVKTALTGKQNSEEI